MSKETTGERTLLHELQDAIHLEADRQDVRCLALMVKGVRLEGSFYKVEFSPEGEKAGTVILVDNFGVPSTRIWLKNDNLQSWALIIVDHTTRVRAAYKKALDQSGIGE